MTRLVIAVCAVLLVGCDGGSEDEEAAPETPPPAWSHDPQDATLGPAAWGELDKSFVQCATGTEQSPIDLPAAASVTLPDLEITYAPAPLVVENTGHTIEVAIPDSGDHTLTIGGDEYRLVQYHFHAPSEHTFEGESYPGEVHLVHESEDGELAVVALLLYLSEDEALSLFDRVLDAAPEGAGQEVEVGVELNPLEMLQVLNPSRALLGGYFGYAGSLTTPGCTEGVRWFVNQGPAPISRAALDRLHELIAGFPGYDGYENNNRPTQSLNEREIAGAVD